MKYLSEKLKSLVAGVLAAAFIMSFAMSCGTASNESDADAAEATEQAEGEHDHPAGEHPTSGDDTEPADTTAMEAEQPESDDDGGSDSE